MTYIVEKRMARQKKPSRRKIKRMSVQSRWFIWWEGERFKWQLAAIKRDEKYFKSIRKRDILRRYKAGPGYDLPF